MAPYPRQAMRHLAAPIGAGEVDSPDAVGESGSRDCGDLVRIQLRIAGGRVRDAAFLAFGCPAATAAASAACGRLRGASLHDALLVSADDLEDDLGGLDADRRHGPEIVGDAVARALESWFSSRLGGRGVPRAARRVAVAMSGGVDSAVAAMLLRDAGWDVVGVTMRLWHDPAAQAAERSCCSPRTVRQARRCAQRLGIPHLTIDAAERFRAGVVEDFIAGYAAGRTPNPCVRCNGEVRFAVLAEAAALLGAERLASGHYARLVPGRRGAPAIARAADAAKDQSYMLAMVSGEIRSRLIFPLGELTKDDVRARARAARLDAAEAVESQEVCFVGQGGYVPFLERNAGLSDRPGPIVDRAGIVLGEHRGYWRYTVGQRRGLGLAMAAPAYVLATDPATNTVVVGGSGELAATELWLDPVIVHGELGADPLEVRIRYRGRALTGSLAGRDQDGLRIALAEPAVGVAAGQTAAIYRDGALVAAGTIAAAAATDAKEPCGSL